MNSICMRRFVKCDVAVSSTSLTRDTLTLPFTLFPVQQSQKEGLDSTEANKSCSKKPRGQGEVHSMAEHCRESCASHTQ